MPISRMVDGAAAGPISRGSDWRTIAAIGAMVVAATFWQLSVPTGSDVSWLIGVAQRVLAGERLYVDVIESNPPVAVFLYMPAVFVEGATGLPAEFAQILITNVMAVVSLAASARVLALCGLKDPIGRFWIAGAFALLILPRYAFAEREHLALILLLPAIVLVFARREAVRIAPGFAIAAGVAAGIGAAIKPHFALLLLVPVAYGLIAQRSLSRLFRAPELVTAAGVAVGFAVLTLVAYPAYVSLILPMEAETYLQVRKPLLHLIADPTFLALLTATVLLYATCGEGLSGRFMRSLLVGGFAAIGVYLLQGKGWPYQLYAAVAIVFIVFLTGVLPRLAEALRTIRIGRGDERRTALMTILATLLLLPLTSLCSTTYFVAMPLAPAVRAVADHPRIFALSDDLGIGHPLTRSVGGTWVGRVCAQLIQATALVRRNDPAADDSLRSRMDKWIAWDRDEIRFALAQQPDVVLVDHDTFDLAALTAARPDIAGQLAHYAKTTSAGPVDLLVRRDLVASAALEGNAK